MSVSDKRIYLASRSPRRRELLDQLGVDHQMLTQRITAERGAAYRSGVASKHTTLGTCSTLRGRKG